MREDISALILDYRKGSKDSKKKTVINHKAIENMQVNVNKIDPNNDLFYEESNISPLSPTHEIRRPSLD